jgi:hypothetical protein
LLSSVVRPRPSGHRFTRWPLQGYAPKAREGPYEKDGTARQHPWWRVMCLTGVDYFSSLGYQPGIALRATSMHGEGGMGIALCLLACEIPVHHIGRTAPLAWRGLFSGG